MPFSSEIDRIEKDSVSVFWATSYNLIYSGVNGKKL